MQAPFEHWPEQHWLAAEQAVPPDRHWLVGCTQTFDAHWFEQQSALDPQTWPVALHCVASTHVPLQAAEQHSEGSVHVAESGLHVDAAVHAPPVQTPEQQSELAAQALASARQSEPPDFFAPQPVPPNTRHSARQAAVRAA